MDEKGFNIFEILYRDGNWKSWGATALAMGIVMIGAGFGANCLEKKVFEKKIDNKKVEFRENPISYSNCQVNRVDFAIGY